MKVAGESVQGEAISRSIAVIVWDGNIYKLEAEPSWWRELLLEWYLLLSARGNLPPG